MMIKVQIIICLAVVIIKINDSFYIPQTYKVKMYHRQSLLITNENGTQESSIFKLQTLTEQGYPIQYTKPTGKHDKRFNRKNKIKISQKSENLRQPAIDFSIRSKRSNLNQLIEYDYDKYKHDYYQEEEIKNSTSTQLDDYETVDITTELSLNKLRSALKPSYNVPMDNYCSELLIFRIRVFECFLYGIRTENDNIKQQSGKVLMFWTITYILLASYLWCTKGWCCCCCPCACCHPHDIIHDAKQFLSQNPPGVAKLHSKRQVFYEATDYEKNCYKALENYVYNL